jgi:hypothetical protein
MPDGKRRIVGKKRLATDCDRGMPSAKLVDESP